MWQRRSPPQPGGEVRSQRTRDNIRFRLSLEVRSEAAEHMAVSEPTSVMRRGLELEDMWQRQSPPQLGCEVRSHGTCGSARAHLRQEARSGATGQVAVPEPTLAGKRGLKS
jgi:hypothetical protein